MAVRILHPICFCSADRLDTSVPLMAGPGCSILSILDNLQYQQCGFNVSRRLENLIIDQHIFLKLTLSSYV